MPAPTVIQNCVPNCQTAAQESNAKEKSPAQSTHDWTELLNAWSTLAIAIFAVVTALAVIGQVLTARNSERAWVMVDIKWDGKSQGMMSAMFGETAEGRNISPICVCRNDGKSPAWITEKRIRFVAATPLPKKPDFAAMRVFDSAIEPLGPTKDSERSVTCMSDTAIHPGELGYLYGAVKYRDIFGKSRTTTFGYTVNCLVQEFYRMADYPEYNKHT